jgi:hypothetical protein
VEDSSNKSKYPQASSAPSWHEGAVVINILDAWSCGTEKGGMEQGNSTFMLLTTSLAVHWQLRWWTTLGRGRLRETRQNPWTQA